MKKVPDKFGRNVKTLYFCTRFREGKPVEMT